MNTYDDAQFHLGRLAVLAGAGYPDLVLFFNKVAERSVLLEKVQSAADRYTNCVCEFGNDAPSACAEYYQALEDAVIAAKPKCEHDWGKWVRNMPHPDTRTCKLCGDTEESL